MRPVVVAGAGPVGLACALWLARAGLRVTVLESAPGPRERPCGEGMMPPGVALLDDLGVLPQVLAAGASSFSGISYWSDGREAATAAFPDTGAPICEGLGVRRPQLERTLLDQLLQRSEAEVVFGAPVTGLLYDGGRVAGVLSGDRRYPATAVVGADGIRSTVRERSGLGAEPRPGEKRFGVVGHFRWDLPRRCIRRVEVHLVSGGEVYRTPIGPGAEGWIFLTGEAPVRAWAGSLRERFIGHVTQSAPLAAALAGARPYGRFAATGPFARFATAPWAEGVLLAGDAAGFLDPLTGEGLALGLKCAREASSLLIEHAGRAGPEAGLRYSRWWSGATSDPWLLTRAMLLLVRKRSLGRLVLERLGRNPGVMQRILGVNCGLLAFSDLPSTDLWRLLVM